MKQTSSNLAKLASRVLRGYEPSRDEIESLAASVLSQREGEMTKLVEAELVMRKQRALAAMANNVIEDATFPEQTFSQKAGSWLKSFISR